MSSKTRELSAALAHRQEVALEHEQELKLIHDSATQAGTRGQAILKNAVERMHMRSIEEHAKAALAANDTKVTHHAVLSSDTTALIGILQLYTPNNITVSQAHYAYAAYGVLSDHCALLYQSESRSSLGAVKDRTSEADATTADSVMMLRQLHADGELNIQQAAMKALPECLTSTLAMQVTLNIFLMRYHNDHVYQCIYAE
jgi:hypothetical protein